MTQFFDTMSDWIMKSFDSERQMRRAYIILFHVFLVLGLADVLGGVMYTLRIMFDTGTVSFYTWVIFLSCLGISIFWFCWAQDMLWWYTFKEYKKSAIR